MSGRNAWSRSRRKARASAFSFSPKTRSVTPEAALPATPKTLRKAPSRPPTRGESCALLNACSHMLGGFTTTAVVSVSSSPGARSGVACAPLSPPKTLPSCWNHEVPACCCALAPPDSPCALSGLEASSPPAAFACLAASSALSLAACAHLSASWASLLSATLCFTSSALADASLASSAAFACAALAASAALAAASLASLTTSCSRKLLRDCCSSSFLLISSCTFFCRSEKKPSSRRAVTMAATGRGPRAVRRSARATNMA
mmetsp:Transcript_26837/g.72389  ORF Transcript_26837/g.72389 Transcript_26837/m.72389 type:complete len:261 (+) Transcript_26837:478-1260(+)